MAPFGLKFFLSVIALVFIIEGLPYFLAPTGVKKWLMTIHQMPNSSIRILGFFFMLLGLIILYVALRVM